jgi:addiction module HigA family antidote
MKLSQTALARGIAVPPRRINEIVLGKRAITADTDLRLARYFNMSEGFLYRTTDRFRIGDVEKKSTTNGSCTRVSQAHLREW